ncbi:MAG: DUF5667 domain-containing protein [Bacillota bacterium]
MSKQSKLTRTTLAILTAGTISLSSTLVHANDDGGETVDKVDFHTVTEETSNVLVNDSAVVDAVKEGIKPEEEIGESPSLLPGDFFYFAKLVLEKVKLAFTVDEVKEAKLLAEHAAERLSEAHALFQAGEEDKAIETIEKALETMEEGDWEEQHEESEEVEYESSKSNYGDTEETSENDDITDEQFKEGNETVEFLDEMEEIFAQNIIALKSAMERVKNPVAKATLQKNIEKSYAKLAEKIAKLEDDNDKEETDLEEVHKAVSAPVADEAELTEEVSNESGLELEKVEESTEEVKAAAPNSLVKKAEKNQEKTQRKEAIREQKAEKEKIKAEREAEREKEKAAREKQKAEREAEREREREKAAKEEQKAEREAEREREKAAREKQKAERGTEKETKTKEQKEKSSKGHGDKEKDTRGNGAN